MSPFAAWMLTQEARALLTRLSRVRPFALLEPMVPAANLLPHAQIAIERLPGRWGVATCARGTTLSRLAAWARQAQRHGRGGAAALLVPAPEVQCGAHAVRSLQRRHHSAQRTRVRRLAVGAGCRGSRCAGTAAAATIASRRSSATWIAAPAPRSGARARGCRAAAIEPGGGHPRAARTHGRQRHRVVAGARGRATRPPRCSTSWHRCAPCCAACSAGRRPTAVGWQLLERWISEIVADFWAVARVGIASTMGLIGRRQPAARFRVPGQSRRSASGALDPRDAQLRDGPGACIRIRSGAGLQRCGRRSIRSTASTPNAAALPRSAAAHHAGLRGAAHAAPARVAARTLADRGAAMSPSGSRRGSRAVSGLVPPPRRQMYQAPPSLVFAVIGQATSRRPRDARGREPAAGEAADPLGAGSTLDTAFACATAPRAARQSLAAWVQREHRHDRPLRRLRHGHTRPRYAQASTGQHRGQRRRQGRRACRDCRCGHQPLPTSRRHDMRRVPTG